MHTMARPALDATKASESLCRLSARFSAGQCDPCASDRNTLYRRLYAWLIRVVHSIRAEPALTRHRQDPPLSYRNASGAFFGSGGVAGNGLRFAENGQTSYI